jgi:hypothetical protein
MIAKETNLTARLFFLSLLEIEMRLYLMNKDMGMN